MVFGKWKYIVHTILAFKNLSEKTNIILMVLLLFLTYSLSPKDFKIFFVSCFNCKMIVKVSFHTEYYVYLLSLHELSITFPNSRKFSAMNFMKRILYFHDISDKFTSHLTFNISLTLNELCFTLDPSANIQASL